MGLIGLILDKGLSTNSGHYISLVKAGGIICDAKITRTEFNNFCNSCSCYCTNKAHDGAFRGIGLAPIDNAC